MNPNSSNQCWSKWTITVTPGRQVPRLYEDVKQNTARFIREGFGSATQVHIAHVIKDLRNIYIIKIRTEGHPAHDPQFVEYCRGCFLDFFTIGFGVGTLVETEVKWEAGSKQDGTPAEQLLILPQLRFTED